jgi:hypothetical protein
MKTFDNIAVQYERTAVVQRPASGPLFELTFHRIHLLARRPVAVRQPFAADTVAESR